MLGVSSKKGITLIEVMIAVSLFMVVAIVSSSILIQVAKVEKTSSIQNALYEDMRIVLQQITQELQNGAIDYEEYYNVYVVQESPSSAFLGVNYGIYGSRFYDPGESLDGPDTSNPADLGVECSFPNSFNPITEDCDVIYTLSVDYNTGVNSPGNSDDNAFCSKVSCDFSSKNVPYLFLIDNTGTKKTMIGKKKIAANDYALGVIKLEGEDVDQNGVIETFYCSEEYNCADYSLKSLSDHGYPLPLKNTEYEGFYDEYGSKRGIPSLSDLGQIFAVDSPGDTEFVPISPLRSSIIDLSFIIRPVEDPYKAYGEPDIQVHPSVTIMLTMDLTSEQKENYPGEFEPVTIQTTISAGVLGQIVSYPPVFEVKAPGASSWIQTAL
jgi:hypothetical protein